MKKWLKVSLFGLGILVVLSLIRHVNQNTHLAENDNKEKLPKLTVTKTNKPNTKRDLVINKFRWQKNEVGSVAYHWFTIYNASKRYNYTAIPVRFSYYSEAGDEVGRVDKVIDKAIRIGETIHIDKIEIELRYQHADGADMEILE